MPANDAKQNSGDKVEQTARKQRTDQSASGSRGRLIKAGIDLIRQHGYSATSVEQICQAAGVSKGAFFHHFRNKEALAESCMEAWTTGVRGMLLSQPCMQLESPLERLRGTLDFFVALFENPDVLKSCLIGTTVQETGHSHPQLREAAGRAFEETSQAIGGLIAEAAASRGRQLDHMALARLFAAAMQGGLILHKAGGPDSVVSDCLRHVRDYILGLLLLKPAGEAGRR